MKITAHGTTLTTLLAIVAALASPVSAEPSYSGRAFGLQLDAPTLSSLVACDTGTLPSGGGNLSSSALIAALTANDEFVNAASLACSTLSSGTMVRSVSEVKELNLQLAELSFSASITVTAIHSKAIATCAGASGQSVVTNLMINGVCGIVTGAPNQVVDIPGIGTLVINEQILAVEAITINALHLTLLDTTEIIIGSVHADINDCTGVAVQQTTWGQIKSLYR